jgi:hypothetical protein
MTRKEERTNMPDEDNDNKPFGQDVARPDQQSPQAHEDLEQIHKYNEQSNLFDPENQAYRHLRDLLPPDQVDPGRYDAFAGQEQNADDPDVTRYTQEKTLQRAVPDNVEYWNPADPPDESKLDQPRNN